MLHLATAAAIGLLAGIVVTWLAMRLRAERVIGRLEAQLAAHATMDARLDAALRGMSGEALRENTAAFLQLAQAQFAQLRQGGAEDLAARQQAVGELVAPVREALARVDDRLQRVERERVGAYEALMQQVREMGLRQEALTATTQQLVTSLRAPTVRGRWGEIQLRRVCEMAGMLEHCDFVEQASVEGDAGRLRPDLIVRLPGGKQIIVDAKTPLEAYLRSVEAPNDAERAVHLRDHARQVRDHVGKLSAKAYWSQFDHSPEIVVMFLPGETFFSAALQHDPGLIEHAVERRVIPASPTTLIALLRAAAYGWQQERIAENAAAISDAGRELYERLRVFAGHYGELRRHLGRAVGAFNDSVGSLDRKVLPQARRFRDLGATTAPELEDVGTLDEGLRALVAADAVH